MRSLSAIPIMCLAAIATTNAFTAPQQQHRIPTALSSSSASSAASGAQDGPAPMKPKTFREGEVMGLRLMQDGKPEEAIKGRARPPNSLYSFYVSITLFVIFSLMPFLVFTGMHWVITIVGMRNVGPGK